MVDGQLGVTGSNLAVFLEPDNLALEISRPKNLRFPPCLRMMPMRQIFLAGVLALSARTGLQATVEIQPTGKLPMVQVEHVAAWQSVEPMTWAVPALAEFTHLGIFYVKITYLDVGTGLLRVSYRGSGQEGEVPSSDHTRSSRTKSGGFVASYHEIRVPNLGRNSEGGVLSIRVSDGDGTPLTARSVMVQEEPFRNQDFQMELAEPWRQPLHFDSSAESIAATLKDRIMVGYQGWFRTANDRDDRGWYHWFRSVGDPSPPFYTVDMWPDTRAYHPRDRVLAGDICTRSGRPAYLFSSTSEAVVRHQFWWMRRNGMDCAFLQRFLTTRRGGDDGTPEWVLMNVRKAANAEHRLWAVEYDVSGMPAATAYDVLKRDWSWLVNVLKVTDDPCYAREKGRPVVFLWGLPFPDRNFTPETADQILNYFEHDGTPTGNYVIGSLPNEWAHLSDAWMSHARKYDGIQVWQTHDYAADKRLCDLWGCDYYPHVWPGFSWAHLARKQEPAAYTDRANGRFYRQRIAQALAVGCDRLFVGMFDEYDEGTAIMPMSDDPPLPGPPAGRFITNDGSSPTRWMQITAEARAALSKPFPAETFDKTE